MEAFKNLFRIVETPGKGKGVITKAMIPADTVIYELGGSIVPRKDLSKHSEIENFFQIGLDTFLSRSGGFDDMINHSCNPNCALRIVGNRALLFTLYDIQAGTELTWDYSSTSTDTPETWSMSCACGDYNCRKEISGFHLLNDAQKDYLIKMNAVPDYLKK